MSNDLQAQISTQMGQTLAQLKQVHSEITQLAAATNANNAAHGRFQATASAAFKSAHDGAKNFNEKSKEVGHAITMLHGKFGVFGELLGRIGGLSERAGAGIGRIA